MAGPESRQKIPAITGLGHAVPPTVVTNIDIDHKLGKKEGLTDRVMRMRDIGIERRNWIVPGETAASDLGIKAFVEAVDMAGIKRDAIDRIIVATSSPDHLGSPVGTLIQHRLGLKTDIQVFDLAAACTGWGQALSVAFERNGGAAQAVIGAEIISPMISTKQEQTYILFGDAAGATIIEQVVPDEGAPTKFAFHAGTDGSYLEDLYLPAGGSRMPNTTETLEQGLNAIHMNGMVVKEQAVRRMSEVTQKVLDKAGLAVKDIDLFIPHQANLSIIKETADALNMPQEKVMVTIQDYGNTSAASIPTALYEAYNADRIKRNQYLAFATFGAGLVYIAGVIPMVGLPKR